MPRSMPWIVKVSMTGGRSKKYWIRATSPATAAKTASLRYLESTGGQLRRKEPPEYLKTETRRSTEHEKTLKGVIVL